MPNMLVNTPEANDFFVTAKTDTGRRVLLGDRENLDRAVYNEIGWSHAALSEGIAKIEALANDPTRTPVQRHAAAEKVADGVVARLADTQSKLRGASNRLNNEAANLADAKFAPNPQRGVIEGEIRTYIKEVATKPDGMVKLRALVKSNPEVASVVYHSPAFLMGLAEDAYVNMRLLAVQEHVPEAFEKANNAVALDDLAAKYNRPIGLVRRSFFSPNLAQQASRRVEV